MYIFCERHLDFRETDYQEKIAATIKKVDSNYGDANLIGKAPICGVNTYRKETIVFVQNIRPNDNKLISEIFLPPHELHATR